MSACCAQEGLCGPESCLQIAVLRALQAFCEKDGGDFKYHRLLLSMEERRKTYGTADIGPDLSNHQEGEPHDRSFVEARPTN